MAKKKLQPAAVEASSIDPAKTYEVSFVRAVNHPKANFKFRPVNNPYEVRGDVLLAVLDHVNKDAVKEV